jgi:hypothetical protein
VAFKEGSRSIKGERVKTASSALNFHLSEYSIEVSSAKYISYSGKET